MQNLQPQQDPDPLLSQLTNLIEELDTHTRQNRQHPETALYTEALPRLVQIIKAIRSFFDVDEPPMIQGDFREGSFLEISYQTVTSLEALLVRLYLLFNETDPQIIGCLYMLLTDLYGYDEEQAKAHLQMVESTQKSVQLITPQTTQSDPIPTDPIPTDQKKKSKKG